MCQLPSCNAVRKSGERSHAATAFLASVDEKKKARTHDVHEDIEGHEEQKPKKVS